MSSVSPHWIIIACRAGAMLVRNIEVMSSGPPSAPSIPLNFNHHEGFVQSDSL